MNSMKGLYPKRGGSEVWYHDDTSSRVYDIPGSFLSLVGGEGKDVDNQYI